MAPITSQITNRSVPMRMITTCQAVNATGFSGVLRAGKYQGKRFLNTLAVAAEQPPKPATAAVQAGHHCADWAVHDLGYLPVAESLHVGQVDRHAEAFGKLPQRVGHAGVRYAVKGQLLRGTGGRRGLRGTPMGALQLPVLEASGGQPGLSLPLPVATDERVREDPVQPRPEVGSLLELMERGKRPGVCLLDQVLGVAVISGHPRRLCVQLPHVAERLVELRIGAGDTRRSRRDAGLVCDHSWMYSWTTSAACGSAGAPGYSASSSAGTSGIGAVWSLGPGSTVSSAVRSPGWCPLLSACSGSAAGLSMTYGG